MSRFLFAILFLTCSFSSFYAQVQTGRPGAGGNAPSIGRVYGKIRDAESREPIAYASVTVWQTRPGKSDTLVGGNLTRENGDFNIENLPMGALKVKASFMGYEAFERPVKIAPPENVVQDLGDLQLKIEAKMLAEANVTAEKSAFQMRADRKVFNVDKNLASIGGTAEDVMKVIPSVTVDADGNAALRNQNATILLDGRPTVMTLNQIPAGEIEQVEVITNPGAKFDANTTGGILNIVLKKNKKPGYNCNIGLTWGSRGRQNHTASLNVKQGRWNVSTSYTYTLNQSLNKGFTYRTDLLDGQPNLYFNTDNLIDFKNIHNMGRLAIEYAVDNRNAVTLAGNLMGGAWKPVDNLDFQTLNASGEELSSGYRRTIVNNNFNNYTAQATWKRSFPKKGKELILDGQYIIGRSKNRSDFETHNYLGDGTEPFPAELQQNIGGGKNDTWQMQLDYVDPRGENSKLELGAKAFAKPNYNWLDVSIYDYVARDWVPDSSLTSNFDMFEMINAAYVNYSSRYQKWNYVAGLRFEQSFFDGTEKVKNHRVKFDYPGGGEVWKAFFPSLYLSRKLNERQEFQVNFSRKINRPGWFQVSSFIMFADKYNYRIGNPLLKPEFINLSELNYNLIFGQHNWLSSIYVRHTEDPIAQVAKLSDEDTNVLVSTFVNGKNQLAVGFDNTLKINLLKSVEWTNNLNVFQTKITAFGLENSGWAYNAKTTVTAKLPAAWTLQTTANYESPRIIAQGKTRYMFLAEASIKKDFFKNKTGSLTLAVIDIFDTRRWGQTVETEAFLQDFSRRRDARHAKLTFAWKFGKMDASMFNRGKKPGPRERSGGDEGFGY